MNAAADPSPRVTPTSSIWAFRALWMATALLVAVALARARVAHPNLAVAGWLVVAACVAFALVLLGPAGLTISRLAAPLGVPAAVLAWTGGAPAGVAVTATAAAVLTTVVALSAETGEAFAQAAAYGDERRLPLRPPAVLLVPVLVAWLVWATVVTTGVALLAGAQWLVGGLVTAVGAAACAPLTRRLHPLSLRWLVLVPAGIVVHDPVVLAESLMARTSEVESVDLARAGTDAADLSGPAAGHLLELRFRGLLDVTLAVTREHPRGRALHARSVLLAPSRPGRALAACRAAGLDG